MTMNIYLMLLTIVSWAVVFEEALRLDVKVKKLIGAGLLIFGGWSVLHIGIMTAFGSEVAWQYSIFVQNLLITISFLSMFINDVNSNEHSLLLASTKGIVTVLLTIVLGFMNFNLPLIIIGLLCAMLDGLYISQLVYNQQENMVVNVTTNTSVHIH